MLAIKSNNLLHPILIVPTRWNSCFDMLQRLLTLKPFATNNFAVGSAENLSEDIWIEIEKITKALEPLKILNKSYWHDRKESNPELYRLAMIVFSVPPSQASVERSFSVLNTMFTRQRTRIYDHNLENQLFVALNSKNFKY